MKNEINPGQTVTVNENGLKAEVIKIHRSSKSENSAREILSAINGGDENMGWDERVIAIDPDGNLVHYNAACGIIDDDTVLIERFECDSMGDGWESATAEDVLEWLEENFF